MILIFRELVIILNDTKQKYLSSAKNQVQFWMILNKAPTAKWFTTEYIF